MAGLPRSVRCLTQPHRSSWLVGLLVAAASFWLFVALGDAQLGDPTAARYVYTGAVLIVLIAAEVLRGVRLTAPAVSVAVLFVLFAAAGNIRALGAGESSLRLASRTVSAELGALELARASAPPSPIVDPHYAPVLVAREYFAATAALRSSPADSPAAILRRPEDARLAADGLLQQTSELQIGHASQAVGPSASAPVINAVLQARTSPRGACTELG